MKIATMNAVWISWFASDKSFESSITVTKLPIVSVKVCGTEVAPLLV